MPLNTFNLPGKNVPADKQLAMMRNYLENLKDDIESDLYNIDWNNFSKPLREKLEGLDKELIAQGDVVNSIQANYVSTQYLESEYVYAGTIECSQIQAGTLNSGVIYSGTIAANKVTAGTFQSGVVYAGTLNANQITAGTISTDRLDVGAITAGLVSTDYLESNYIDADTISSTYVSTTYLTSDFIYSKSIKAGQITSGTIDADRISTSSLVFNGLKYTNGSWTLTLTLQECQKYGGGRVYCLGTDQTP